MHRRSESRPQRRRRGIAGVTLLEMLVAVAILAVIAPLLYGTFSRSLATREYAGSRAHVYAVARAAMDWLEQDLRGSFSASSYPSGRNEFFSSGYADDETLGDELPLLEITTATALGTASLARLDEPIDSLPSRADQARVAYHLEEPGGAHHADDDRSIGLDLVRYDLRPALDDEELEEASRSVVARGIVSVSLRFFDGQSWLDKWDSRSRGDIRGTAPRAVETRLTLQPTEGDEMVFVSAVALELGGQRESESR